MTGRADVLSFQVDGQRVLAVCPTIPDDAPERVREGLARRRLVTITGTCPCGAVRALPNRRQRREMAREGGIWHVDIAHETDCPAIDQATRRVAQDTWGPA